MPKFSEDKQDPVIRNTQQIGSELGEVYYIEKDAADELKDLRVEFFVAAKVAKELEPLARKTVAVPEGLDHADAVARILKYHSGYRLVDDQDEDSDRLVLEEDPDLIPHEVVIQVDGGVIDSKGNEHPGYVITKSIRAGSSLLDDERLRDEDPDLWEEVTVIPNYDYLYSLLLSAGVEEDDIDEKIANSNIERVPLHPDKLTRSQTAALAEYLYEGAKTKALLVRYAKDEELGEG
jgi:hypothetical protein